MKGFSGDVTLKRLDEYNYELEGNLTYENSEVWYGLMQDIVLVSLIISKINN